jgi:hypothetical protein
MRIGNEQNKPLSRLKIGYAQLMVLMNRQRIGTIMIWMVVIPCLIIGVVGIGYGIWIAPIPILSLITVIAFLLFGFYLCDID